AGLKADARPDARAVLWCKLVLNSAVNPLTALARCTNGTILLEPTLFGVAKHAAGEAARVGWKLGILEKGFDYEAALHSILHETAGNRSSMLEDLDRGRRTEVEEITGAVVRLAKEAGEPAPTQEALLTLIRAAENRLQNCAGRPLGPPRFVPRSTPGRLLHDHELIPRDAVGSLEDVEVHARGHPRSDVRRAVPGHAVRSARHDLVRERAHETARDVEDLELDA